VHLVEQRLDLTMLVLEHGNRVHVPLPAWVSAPNLGIPAARGQPWRAAVRLCGY
jgi:hypothetical protein